MRSYPIVQWGAALGELTVRVPEARGEEVLVRVERCGVCHSDVHIREGSFDMGAGRRVAYADLGVRLPFTMGHEIVGTVAAAGSPEGAVHIGKRVVVYPWMGCGSCAACRDGRDIDCEQNASLGTRRDGGYADYVLVPHARYLLDFGRIDPNLAATCACSGLTAFSALKKLPPIASGEALLLIGAGGLGLAAIGLAKAFHGAHVVVADIDEAKLAAARGAGADVAFDSARDDAAIALREAAARPIRGIIDFVGSPATVRLALEVAAKGASIVVVGLFGGSIELSTALLPMRNLTLRGSYVGSLAEMRELLRIVDWMGGSTLPISTRPMREVNATLDDLRDGRIVGRVVATVEAAPSSG